MKKIICAQKASLLLQSSFYHSHAWFLSNSLVTWKETSLIPGYALQKAHGYKSEKYPKEFQKCFCCMVQNLWAWSKTLKASWKPLKYLLWFGLKVRFYKGEQNKKPSIDQLFSESAGRKLGLLHPCVNSSCWKEDQGVGVGVEKGKKLSLR